MVRTRRIAAAVASAVVLLVAEGGAAPTAIATPAAPTTVRAGAGDHTFTWRTPVEAASKVTIANRTGADSASTVMTLHDSTAPNAYTFELNLPAGTAMIADGKGGYDLVDNRYRAARTFAHLDAPWAVDAAGRSLPTAFKLEGSRLTQTIDTREAAYPITADPHYTWGIITGTIYFNRQETRDIAYSTGAATAFMSVLPPPFDFLFAGASALLAARAAIADNHGECLKVKSDPSIGFYRGGYCK